MSYRVPVLEIWTANPPNGRKAAIMLEQIGLADPDDPAGDYTSADITTLPWIKAYRFSGLTLDNHPNLQAWHDRLWQRPAVARGMDGPQSGPAS